MGTTCTAAALTRPPCTGALREAVAAEGHHGALSVALRLLGRLSRHDEEVLAEYSTPSQLREDAAVALAVALEPTHEALRSDALSCSGHLASAALRLGEATHHKEKEDEQEQDLEFSGSSPRWWTSRLSSRSRAEATASTGRLLVPPCQRPRQKASLLYYEAPCLGRGVHAAAGRGRRLRGWCGEEVGGAIGCGGVQASVVLEAPRPPDLRARQGPRVPRLAALECRHQWILGILPPRRRGGSLTGRRTIRAERGLSLQLALLQIVRLAGDEAQTKLRAYLRDFWGEDDNVTRGAGRAPPRPLRPRRFSSLVRGPVPGSGCGTSGPGGRGNDERVVELVGWWGGGPATAAGRTSWTECWPRWREERTGSTPSSSPDEARRGEARCGWIAGLD